MRCTQDLALPLGELAAKPAEREKGHTILIFPFKSACKALSVTFGDSSPKGRAKEDACACLIIACETERIRTDTLR